MTFRPVRNTDAPIRREVEIRLTVCEVAQAFADMSAADQAMCLHEIALVFLSWGNYERDHQILSIAESMNPDGSATGLVNDILTAIHDRKVQATIGGCNG